MYGDDDDDDDGGPEGDQVVLHEGEDLGVQLRVAGQHLQRLIHKPAKLLFDKEKLFHKENILIFLLSNALLERLVEGTVKGVGRKGTM